MKVVDYLLSQFKQLQKRKFYGKLVLEFKNGEFILMRIEETTVPPKDLE